MDKLAPTLLFFALPFKMGAGFRYREFLLSSSFENNHYLSCVKYCYDGTGYSICKHG